MAQAAVSPPPGARGHLLRCALLRCALPLLAAGALACVALPSRNAPPRFVMGTSSGAAVAGNRAYRWSPHAHHPLRFWVEPTSRLPGWTPARLAEVDHALRAWEASGVVEIARTTRQSEADIRLYWSNGLPSQHPGVTLLHPDAHGDLVHADIWVNVSAPARRRASADEVEYGIIAHEIGHALGLPHADERGDIMYPVLYTLSVTPDDLDALRTIVTGRAATREGRSVAAGGGDRN